ncbi:general secretion pathway protein GspJ [Luteibacter sp. SG786]|uniref:general secretion pathway protein GspJ n=1 Tax=Luteibacter sp. SG786 TaxID=2587130 RepID=UPI001423C5F4|nr:general secretion pathway protein GspJ [Luteibacter sp. SG786]NII54854.1 general secretion pathway protein J [Luteibacter sp. SG786]
MTKVSGFSLMETLAALALLALLLLGVFASLDTIARSTHSSLAATERLDQMRAAQNYLRRALSGALPYPWALGKDKQVVVFRGDGQGATFVSPGPGYLANEGLQLQTLSLVGEPGDQRLVIAFAPLPTRSGAGVVPASPETLLEHIASGRIVYGGSDAHGRVLPWRTSWSDEQRMPTMVGIELTLRHGLRWPTFVVPLRMDPGAVNDREAYVRLAATGATP